MIVQRVNLACVVLAAASTLARGDALDAAAGKALFDRNWVPAPSSTNASDGLGPLFNARSCANCHTRGGGAHIQTREGGDKDLVGAVVRFGSADGTRDPFYGLQLQTNAVPGLKPEGTAIFLPKLEFSLTGPPLAPGTKAGARLAPELYDKAAFDRIPDSEILKRADPDDHNGDGIKGRANMVAGRVGRFGWKAAHATLDGQIAHAFNIDIGLSSPLEPYPYGECSELETACRSAANGESPAFENRELSSQMIELVAAYLESLTSSAAAASTTADALGAELFDKSGCAACHVPDLTDRNGKAVPAFSDLLLHDMGPDLDDGVGEPGVKSSEWRTAPLIQKSNPGALERRYLHDGSAATVAAAIGRHGGEALNSRRAFETLSAGDQQRLIDYVDRL